eukprot:957107_1
MFPSSSRSKKVLKSSLVAMTLYALLILICRMHTDLMSQSSETKTKDVHEILETKGRSFTKSQLIKGGSQNVAQSQKERPLSPSQSMTSKSQSSETKNKDIHEKLGTKGVSSVKSNLINAGSLNVAQSGKERPLSPRQWPTSKKILNKTYSQKNQDRGMYYRYFQNMDSPGTFIELGANDGTSMSNTKLYEDALGWSGLCIEGDPVLFKSLKQNRPNCTNVHAIITDKPGNVTWKYRADHETGLVQAISGNDTLIKEFSRFPVGGTTIVKGTPLVDMLREHNIHHVDFFSLDVDGAECTLLKTIDFRKVDVRTFLIETHSGGKYGIRETAPQCVRDVLTRNHSDCPIRENTVILSPTLKRTERPILSNMFSSSSRSKKWLKRSLVAMTLYALLILISIMRINLMSHPSETKNKDVHDILDTKSVSSVKSQLVNAGSLNVSQSEKERPLSPRKWSTSKKI